MAKRKKKRPVSREAVALAAALPPDVPVIDVPAGGTLEVDVDVNDMSIPYTIAWDGDVLIKSLVDRREAVDPLPSGMHRLGWAFTHALKGWKHTLAVIVNGQRTVLEERSEEEKQQEHSVGIAFVIVG